MLVGWKQYWDMKWWMDGWMDGLFNTSKRTEKPYGRIKKKQNLWWHAMNLLQGCKKIEFITTFALPNYYFQDSFLRYKLQLSIFKRLKKRGKKMYSRWWMVKLKILLISLTHKMTRIKTCTIQIPIYIPLQT